MHKQVRIIEVGTVSKFDEVYLCLNVTIIHNGYVIEHKIWLAHFDTPTAAIAKQIMDAYLADSFEYQTMWFHSELLDEIEEFRWVLPLG